MAMARNPDGIVNSEFSATGDALNPSFYSTGFPETMSQIGSGVFPPRTTFNYLFKILTALATDLNSFGCMLPWINSCNYSSGAMIIGSNGKSYKALQASGPDNGGAQDPTTADTYWEINLAAQPANQIAVTGGNIDDVIIGETTPEKANFTTAFDNGEIPIEDNQLTNKAYTDGTVTETASGTAIKYGNGYLYQWGKVPIPAGTDEGGTIVFPVPFTVLDSVSVSLTVQNVVNANLVTHLGAGTTVTLTGCTASVSQPSGAAFPATVVYWTAFGK